MQINWFTVIAQMINFLVLVWLMKKYLYKPILQAVDEREKKIASELKEAKTKMVEAKKEQDEFQQKNEAFDSDKKKMMAKATADAANERQDLLDAAKKEAADVKLKLHAASAELQENLSNEVVQKMQQKVFDITKKVLSEFTSTDVEAQLVEVFIHKIKNISDSDKKQFIDAFHSESSPIVIKTASKLSEKDHKSIKSAIDSVLGDHSKYEFTTDSKMIGGVDLATNGYKLSWSFSAYLNSLEKNMTSIKNEAQQVALI
ncbi:F0F1 ATP synthase subunit B [Pedobacter changchengzhani]|uniref:ATP synthase subunit b n=1 Tax=Pedobacter changchengzhani TaxID=2529274 RepID=A0A4R5MLG0_9SPHI|nr:F0F1 ATP synthase subunit B [Pedobacter changchengzhani]TDG36468.1 F0F1 ATP synthase subunit B [Pedobacter changchengzhani]